MNCRRLLLRLDVDENYVNIKNLLERINYYEYNFLICVDLKMVGILMGLQSGYTTHPCYLCLFQSCEREIHYTVKNWPTRKAYVPGNANVVNLPLVRRHDILLPPLHIKLGLFQQFTKKLEESSESFQALQKLHSHISLNKLKNGILNGPEIRKLMASTEFENALTIKKKAAWISFKDVCTKFLGNHKDPNYKEIIRNMIIKYKAIKANVSLKLHFMMCHLDVFPQLFSLGSKSDEQGER